VSETTISPNVFEQLRTVITILSEARSRADERARATHERFNIFTTLLSPYNEVRLHTRFLHCLLDPKGYHDCGRLFLDLFLSTLTELPGLDHEDNALSFELPCDATWTVQKEVFLSPYGQINLLIERNGFGIAIENKIFAGEQDEQLARYANYLTDSCGEMGHLIYLTLDGKKSSTDANVGYSRISYATHILNWLDKCLRETYDIVPINQVLLQYRRLVRDLTGKTAGSDFMNTISDFITQHPDIVRFNQQFNDGIAGARAAFLDRLADGIIKELEGDLHVRFRSNPSQRRFGMDNNGALIITPSPASPLCDAHLEICVEHIAKFKGLVVGIESKYDKPESSTDHQDLFARLNEILNRQSKAVRYHKADPQPSSRETYWPTGWHNLIYPIDDEMLATLLETPLAKTVSKVCNDILDHIKLLEEAYREAVDPRPATGRL
jgi:hypothetical protein